ncbi:hydrogenase maturation protease [Amycolatopsis sp. NPDC049252]|uniref:hydrogenase maturation protease n=1 Tax=Amycolatopsis sp. NPDC049252 TaxID=3363933 RepID=UPI00371A5494
MTAVVLGLGNPLRGDDGIGPAVAEAVRLAGVPGVRVVRCVADPAELVDAWADADPAVLVDAVRSRSHDPGEVLFFTGGSGWPGGSGRGTHALGVDDAIRLGRALGRSPRRLVAVGVAGAAFEPGAGMSPPVAAALPAAVEAVLAALGAPEGLWSSQVGQKARLPRRY